MKAKIITTAILSISTAIYNIINPVSALEYTTNYGNNFTIRPSISVSLSSASATSSADLIISDLVPGNSQDSNEIIVNVESNNISGYVLNSSVGNDSAYASSLDNLVNITSNNYKFTNLAPDADLASIDDSEENNVWGYSYATYNAESSTWNTWSNYNGLPLYNDTNLAVLNSTIAPSAENGDSIKFKIAAKASNTQGSGEYTNIINFIAVANPTPTSFYDAFANAASQPGSTISQLNGYYKMQDMTPDICEAVGLYDDQSHIQLIDTRDNEVYWIGKLKDNRCWLLDNLRLGSNDHGILLTPQDTNIAEDWTLPRGITSNFNSYIAAQINAAYENDTNITSYGTASGKVGAYYNYCAASGGTYCYGEDSNTDNTAYDICPANWRLPTGGSGGEYQEIHGKYGTTGTNLDSLQHNLAISLSGTFAGQEQYDFNQYAQLWTATYGKPLYMYRLFVTSNSVASEGSWHSRTGGLSVRCIANNE